MSNIKAPNFRDVVPACCYNCQESEKDQCEGCTEYQWLCRKYGHDLGDAGLKICDDYVEEEY